MAAPVLLSEGGLLRGGEGGGGGRRRAQRTGDGRGGDWRRRSRRGGSRDEAALWPGCAPMRRRGLARRQLSFSSRRPRCSCLRTRRRGREDPAGGRRWHRRRRLGGDCCCFVGGVALALSFVSRPRRRLGLVVERRALRRGRGQGRERLVPYDRGLSVVPRRARQGRRVAGGGRRGSSFFAESGS